MVRDPLSVLFQVDPVTEPGKWVDWMRTIPDFAPPKNATFESMVVPTVDSVRLSYVFDRLMRNKSHVLIPGSTGTGKTCCRPPQPITKEEIGRREGECVAAGPKAASTTVVQIRSWSAFCFFTYITDPRGPES